MSQLTYIQFGSFLWSSKIIGLGLTSSGTSESTTAGSGDSDVIDLLIFWAPTSLGWVREVEGLV